MIIISILNNNHKNKNRHTMEINAELTKRIRIDYDVTEQMVLKNSKNIVLLEIDNKKLKGESIIYDNQEECSLSIVSNLHNKKLINIMIVALTQSGKTGTMSGLIKIYLNDTTNLIPIKNIYIITGLSSREWVEQTINRMPKSIQERVFHRDNLTNKFVDNITPFYISNADFYIVLNHIKIIYNSSLFSLFYFFLYIYLVFHKHL